jgi:hypothetical protein
MAEYPDDADGAVLADLAAQGVDLSQPLQIDFQVAAPDEAGANAIAGALTKAGYDVEIEYDPGEPDEEGEIDPDDEEFGPAWTVVATRQMIPVYNELIRIQAELDRLAGPYDGYSDGWGVLVDGDAEDEE